MVQASLARGACQSSNKSQSWLLITVASRDETLNGILICADFLLLSSCFLPLRMEKLSTKTHQLRDKKISNDSQKNLRRLRGIGNRTLN